jgi:hypothetical protein
MIICIEHLSKYCEVIPLPCKEAAYRGQRVEGACDWQIWCHG